LRRDQPAVSRAARVDQCQRGRKRTTIAPTEVTACTPLLATTRPPRHAPSAIATLDDLGVEWNQRT
jgi:hypothetical protein